MLTLCGGQTKAFNPELHKELARYLKSNFEGAKPLEIRTQIVAGKNYFVKLELEPDIDDRSYCHVQIYRDLNGNFYIHKIKRTRSSVDLANHC